MALVSRVGRTMRAPVAAALCARRLSLSLLRTCCSLGRLHVSDRSLRVPGSRNLHASPVAMSRTSIPARAASLLRSALVCFGLAHQHQGADG